MNLPPFDGHATDIETLEVLFALVRLQKPEVVVEAGTYRGHGAIFMGSACKQNKGGMVHTADPFDNGQMATLNNAGLSWWVRYWPEDYLSMLETISGPIDLAFIDASAPDATGARLRWEHFEATLPRMRPGGMVCVHDTAADDWSDGEGGISVNRIRERCQINLTTGRGLSIYHV